ncbi:MAG: hypothetical protein IJJ69_01170 [Oscillospiraceae bacterium]|nr:hypothetical protein [Oscillospiraceae bacterium]
MSVLLILGIVLMVLFAGGFIGLSQSEYQENDEEQKKQHLVSAIVILLAFVLLASVIIVPIVMEIFF